MNNTIYAPPDATEEDMDAIVDMKLVLAEESRARNRPGYDENYWAAKIVEANAKLPEWYKDAIAPKWVRDRNE